MVVPTTRPHTAIMESSTMPPPTPSPPPPNGPYSEQPWLRRSRRERMIAGIAGGVSERYGWDVALVRIAFVLLALVSGGAGLVAYVVVWLVVPEDDSYGAFPAEPFVRTDRRRTGRLWLGVILLWFGVDQLFERLDIGLGLGRVVWPLALITGGVALLVVRHPPHSRPAPSDPNPPPDRPAPSDGPDRTGHVGTGATDPGGAVAGEQPAAADAAVISDDTAPTVVSAYPASPGWPHGRRAHERWDRGSWGDPPWAGSPWADTSPGSDPPWPPGPPGPPRHRRHPHRPRRERSALRRVTWSALLMFAGAAWLADLSGAVDVDLAVALAIGVGIVGMALVVGAWFGRSRGLIALGVMLLVPSAFLSQVDVPLHGGIGEKHVRPLALADIAARYELGIGELDVDLSAVQLDGARVEIELTNGLGEINIAVPTGTAVDLRGRAGMGEVDLLDASPDDGFDVDLHVERLAPTSGVFVIDARVGIGTINVNWTEPTILEGTP